MDIASLVVSLISGLAGGNAAGAAMPKKGLGTLGNSISGLVGGGLSGWALQAFDIISKAMTTGGMEGFDFGSLLGNIGASGGVGAALTAIIALIKNSMENGKS